MNDDVMEQLMLLRALTSSTGVLHEAQVLQLKMWPACFFKGVKSHEFVFQWERRKLAYDIKAKGKHTHLKKRCVALEKCVHTLLGGEYQVTILLNGKKVFSGGPAIVREPKQPVYDREKFEEAVRKRNFEAALSKAVSDDG